MGTSRGNEELFYQSRLVQSDEKQRITSGSVKQFITTLTGAVQYFVFAQQYSGSAAGGSLPSVVYSIGSAPVLTNGVTGSIGIPVAMNYPQPFKLAFSETSTLHVLADGACDVFLFHSRLSGSDKQGD